MLKIYMQGNNIQEEHYTQQYLHEGVLKLLVQKCGNKWALSASLYCILPVNHFLIRVKTTYDKHRKPIPLQD